MWVIWVKNALNARDWIKTNKSKIKFSNLIVLPHMTWIAVYSRNIFLPFEAPQSLQTQNVAGCHSLDFRDGFSNFSRCYAYNFLPIWRWIWIRLPLWLFWKPSYAPSENKIKRKSRNTKYTHAGVNVCMPNESAPLILLIVREI